MAQTNELGRRPVAVLLEVTTTLRFESLVYGYFCEEWRRAADRLRTNKLDKPAQLPDCFPRVWPKYLQGALIDVHLTSIQLAEITQPLLLACGDDLPYYVLWRVHKRCAKQLVRLVSDCPIELAAAVQDNVFEIRDNDTADFAEWATERDGYLPQGFRVSFPTDPQV